jgi:hypothetical protein
MGQGFAGFSLALVLGLAQNIRGHRTRRATRVFCRQMTHLTPGKMLQIHKE